MNMHISQKHIHTLCLVEGSENFEALRIALGSCIGELADVQKEGITVNGVHHPVEFWLCSDWKFLAIVMSIVRKLFERLVFDFF